MVGFCDFVGVGIAPVSKKPAVKGHFWSVAKVALRFECAKQSKNHKKYLLNHTVIREKTNVKKQKDSYIKVW